MKFPRNLHGGGVLSLILIAALLLSPALAQRPPARTAPPPVNPPAAVAAKPESPEVTFDTLLSADAYGVYGEVRMIGQQLNSPELDGMLAPLITKGGAPNELLDFYAFVKSHSEELTAARIMFAAMPVREGLPEIITAVEMPSVEAAQKLAPELRQLLTAHLNPPKNDAAPVIVNDGSTPTTTTAAVPTTTTNAATPTNDNTAPVNTAPANVNTTPTPTTPPTRCNRLRARTPRTSAVTVAAASDASAKPPAVAPFHLKRSGKIIAMSDTAFTFKALRGAGDALLVNDPGFQAARTRFATDTIFVYFNPVRMERSSGQQREARQKKYEEEARAEAQRQKEIAQTNANTSATVNQGDSGETDGEGNENANVAGVTDGNMNAPLIVNDPDVVVQPTPTPTAKELEEEERREQAQAFSRAINRVVFSGDPSSSTNWSEAIGVGASLDGDALVLRALFVNLSDDKPLRPIPFVPIMLSGPSIAADAASVLPADTDIFASASLDLPQMYDYMASALKILDLAPSEKPGKGNFTEQLNSFEKVNKFRIREELLSSLGNEIAVALPAAGWFGSGRRSGARSNASGSSADGDPSAVPSATSPVIVISLADKRGVQELLPRVLASVGFAGATEQSVIEKQGDVEMLTFSNGTIAFIGNFLIAAPDAATMRWVTRAYNRGETLANSEGYRNAVGWQSRQALGQVYVSNAMLKSAFEDVPKALEDIEDQDLRTYLLRLDPDPGAITHLATKESNGLMHELHLPKNLLALFTASAMISDKLSTLRGNESRAQWRLRSIAGLENAYKEDKGRYATLDELKATGSFQEEYESLDIEGYELKVSISGDKFEATATPTNYPKLGRRSFYLDQTSILRGGDLRGKRASASDPTVEQ